jgi:hypothetical protein
VRAEALDLPEDTAPQTLSKYQLLTKLATDFLSMAKNYGQLSSSEFGRHVT